MVTVAPGATAIGYLYPCWGAGPAPFGSTDCFALMMYSGPTTTSPGPGATTPAFDRSVQESISWRPGVPAARARCACSFGCCVAADEHPAARPTAMASATSRTATLLRTVPSVNLSNTDRPELRRTQRLPGVQEVTRSRSSSHRSRAQLKPDLHHRPPRHPP